MARSRITIRAQRTDDPIANRVGGAVDPTAIRQIAAYPPLAGQAIVGAAISHTQDTRINHGLRRTPVGMIVTKLVGGAAAIRWVSADDLTLVVRSSADTTADLWVWLVMPIASQIITIKLTGGLQEAVDAKLVEPGSFITLRNCVVDQAGKIQKRNGYGTMSRTTFANTGDLGQTSQEDTLPVSPETVFSVGDELITIGTPVATADTKIKYLHSYTFAGDYWINVGPTQQFSAHRKKMLRQHVGVWLPTMGQTSVELRWAAWIDNLSTLNVKAVDLVTGAELSPLEQPISNNYFTAFALGNDFIVLSIVGDDPYKIRQTRYSRVLETLNGDPSDNITFQNGVFDACPIPIDNNLYVVAYVADNDGNINVELWDKNNGTYERRYTITATAIRAIAVNCSPTRVHVAWVETSSDAIKCQSFDNLLNSQYAASTIDTTVGATNINRLAVGCGDQNGPIVIAEYDSAGNTQNPRCEVLTVSSSGSLTDTNNFFNARIHARPFLYNNRAYGCFFVQDGDSPDAAYGKLGTVVVTLLDGTEVSQVFGLQLPLVGNFGIGNTSRPCNPNASSVHKCPPAHVAPGYASTDTTGKKYLVPVTTVLAGIVDKRPDLGGDYYEIDFNGLRSNLHKPIAVGGSILLVGAGTSLYDGRTVVEMGFLDVPKVSATPGTPGNIPIGSYQYCATYEWYDGKNLHQSRPSVPVTVTLAAASFVDLVARSLGISSKELASRGRQDVRIVYYRTENNGTTFYRLTARSNRPTTTPTPINDPNSNTSGDWTDNITDTELLGLGFGLLYTSGGVLDNDMPPPSIDAIAHKGRVWLISGDDDHDIWYSKILTAGEAPGFSAALKIRLDEAQSGATALASLDDAIIVFTKDKIFSIRGDGPNDAGLGGSFSEPAEIASDTGCEQPRSVAQTQQGVVFKGRAGIYLLDRSGSVSLISDPVQTTISENPYVLRTRVDAARQRIYFLVSSSTDEGYNFLVYDYGFNQWSKWDFEARGITDHCVWLGYHVMSDEAGINRESLAVGAHNGGYDRDESWIPMEIELPDVKAAGIGGNFRVRSVRLLGDKRTHCVVNTSLFYDYKTAASIAASWDLGASTTVLGLPIFRGGWRLRKQRCEAARIKITDAESTAVSGSPNGITLSAVAIEVAVLPGASRLAAVNRRLLWDFWVNWLVLLEV